MKKIYLLMLLLLTTSISTNAKKPKPKLESSIEITSHHSERGRKITFDWFASEYLPIVTYFRCINNTDERIYIEWENARMNGEKIVFGTDSELSMYNSKADEAVLPRENSLKRNLTSDLYVKYINITGGKVFNYKKLKKKIGEKSTQHLRIPIRFSDNKVEVYDITVSVWYEMPSNE